ncbi:MAG: dihydropteroate synthase [Salibacteraceae bacterium]|jgi:dihydropteroate synthase
MQDKLITKKTSLNFRGKLEDINDLKIMGILNLTPDSFYDGGVNTTLEVAIKNVKKMLHDGADIIDIGAYSSRPGAKKISIQEEIDRLMPVISALIKEIPQIKISVDTFRSKVAKEAIEQGALMINDISAGDLDSNMWATVAQAKVPYVAMHMQGTPQNMQSSPAYNHLLEDILLDLSTKVAGMKSAGIMDIIIDPGFGFGKTLVDNYELMRNLRSFELLGFPILVGISRKSMIYNLLHCSPEESLNGTTVLNTLALSNGADILRVHDVKQAKETLTIFEKVSEPFGNPTIK